MENGIFGSRDAQCEVCRTLYRKGERCPREAEHASMTAHKPEKKEETQVEEKPEASSETASETKDTKKKKTR